MIKKYITLNSSECLSLSVGNTFSLQKKATPIDDYVKVIKIEPKKVKLHVIAMGAGEAYGPNQNGDYFPEEALKKHVKSFERFGKVYKHHQNTSPDLSCGEIEYSWYNPKMRRVELIITLDRDKCKEEVEKISQGEPIAVSMSCKYLMINVVNVGIFQNL